MTHAKVSKSAYFRFYTRENNSCSNQKRSLSLFEKIKFSKYICHHAIICHHKYDCERIRIIFALFRVLKPSTHRHQIDKWYSFLFLCADIFPASIKQLLKILRITKFKKNIYIRKAEKNYSKKKL